MNRLSSFIASAVLTSVAVVNPVLGQSERTLNRTPQCLSCQLSVTKLASIKDDGEKVVLGDLSVVTMIDSMRAAIWSSMMEGFRVLNLVTGDIDKIGRRGAGPGEYSGITNMLGRPDGSVFVLDRVAWRVSHLSNEFKVLRTFPLQDVRGVSSSIVSSGGFIVNSGPLASGGSFGTPLHVYGADGRFRLSFGGTNLAHEATDDIALARRLAAAHDNTFWSLSPINFRLEQWTLNGKLLQAISFTDTQLRRNAASEWHTGPDAPPDHILALSMYGRDTALIVTRVSKRPWTKVPPHTVSNEEGRSTTYPIRSAERDQYFATRLDLIDLKSARLITSTVIPMFAWGAGDRELNHPVFDANEVVTFELLRVSLRVR